MTRELFFSNSGTSRIAISAVWQRTRCWTETDIRKNSYAKSSNVPESNLICLGITIDRIEGVSDQTASHLNLMFGSLLFGRSAWPTRVFDRRI